MKRNARLLTAGGLVSLALAAHSATRYVNLNSPGPAAPYTTWATAATNIQLAVDVASAGDDILVAPGVYQTGAQSVYGMSNRVAVTKPVSVRSLSGPTVTSIVGYQMTNGPAAVRCVYLTNGAALAGFTLTKGATQTFQSGLTNGAGGGVWCESATAIVSNCVVSGNSAYYGGGAYSGTLNNCALMDNSAISDGGGAYSSTLNNCTLMANSATNHNGGGAHSSTLNNCLLTSNSARFGGGAYSATLNNCTLSGNSSSGSGGGAYSCTLNNCVVYYNTAPAGNYPPGNYDSSTLNYCCTTPLPAGPGNFTNAPLFADTNRWNNLRLLAASPCIDAGTNANAPSNTDLDGNPRIFGGTVDVGAYEYQFSPLQPALITQPIGVGVTVGGTASFSVSVSCTGAVSYFWRRDGSFIAGATNAAYTTNNVQWSDLGSQFSCLVSNSYGTMLSSNAMVLVAPAVHYVALASTNPFAPYPSWTNAAINIQHAVDAAAPGDLVLVADGIYQIGAWVTNGESSRVAITKPVTVRSVNGPAQTFIMGTSAGSGAMRCVYLTSGAVLAGFTLANGAAGTSSYGGGVYCESSNAVVANCVLTGNSAAYAGGGAFSGILSNCTLTWNAAGLGGGAFFGTLYNCTLMWNAAQSGGGAAGDPSLLCVLNNCTLTGNSATSFGGGAYRAALNDCTLTTNSASSVGGGAAFGTLNHCTLLGNSAYGNGGGAWNGALTNCTLTGNSASSYGGGADGSMLTYCTLTGNSASYGGGASAGTLVNCSLSGNWATNSGGGASGATLANCTLAGNSADSGGGTDGGALINCTLTNNRASSFGGGAYSGTLTNCLLTGNSTDGDGGGAYQSSLTHCTLTSNSARYGGGGGTFSTTLTNCTLTGNSAAIGGGASGGTLLLCALTGNRAINGGGADSATLNNCLLTGNAARFGGGSGLGSLTNCTVAGNSATNQGGGTYGGTLRNCIIYFNSAPTGANYYNSGTPNYCCSTPLPAGTGNFTNNPLFLATNGWSNLRLQTNSPCINAGDNAGSVGAADLDGNVRFAGGRVDVGAYEFQGVGLSGFTAWLWQYGLRTDGSDNSPDTDHDGFNNWQEWIAGTDPTNSLSALQLLSVANTPSGALITWSSVTNRSYALYSAADLGAMPAFPLLQSNIAGSAGTTSWTDTNALAHPQLFYRVEVGN